MIVKSKNWERFTQRARRVLSLAQEEAEKELLAEINKGSFPAFARAVVASDLESALPVILQVHGLGKLPFGEGGEVCAIGRGANLQRYRTAGRGIEPNASGEPAHLAAPNLDAGRARRDGIDIDVVEPRRDLGRKAARVAYCHGRIERLANDAP